MKRNCKCETEQSVSHFSLGENRFDRMKILVTMLDQNLADMDSGRLDEHKKARFKREPVIWALLLCASTDEPNGCFLILNTDLPR